MLARRSPWEARSGPPSANDGTARFQKQTESPPFVFSSGCQELLTISGVAGCRRAADYPSSKVVCGPGKPIGSFSLVSTIRSVFESAWPKPAPHRAALTRSRRARQTLIAIGSWKVPIAALLPRRKETGVLGLQRNICFANTALRPGHDSVLVRNTRFAHHRSGWLSPRSVVSSANVATA
jgi:hypothetical protein